MRGSRGELGPLTHEGSDEQEADFTADLKKRGWKEKEIDAALAGWGYVLDQCVRSDGYSDDRMEGDGSDEARDMAVCLCDGGEGWRKRDVEMVADLVYDGVTAALTAVRTGRWRREKLFKAPADPKLVEELKKP